MNTDTAAANTAAAASVVTLADKAKAQVKANLVRRSTKATAGKATPALATSAPVAKVKAAPVVKATPAPAKAKAPAYVPQASVKGEPLTNYVAHDINGRHLPLTVNGQAFKSTADRSALLAVQYGPVYAKGGLFVTITLNEQGAVARGVDGIRGRWNSVPSRKLDFDGGARVPEKVAKKA